ncbi:MAG TPA: hypothetical protein VFD73_15400, partial [Gemmatimonadales bacterium]|nr:hypothetical protein [Gemmatimonadales bacterium]
MSPTDDSPATGGCPHRTYGQTFNDSGPADLVARAAIRRRGEREKPMDEMDSIDGRPLFRLV